MKQIKHIILAAVIGLGAGAAAGFFLTLGLHDKRSDVEIKEVVTYRDTSFSRLDLNKPTNLPNTPVCKVPLICFYPDTVTKTIVKDSIRYMVLNREFKYLSKDNVDIWYSGINPTIDSLHVRHTDRTVTQTISATPRKWSLNAFAGVDFGKTPNSQYASPNIGAELNYKKWAFGVSAGFSMEIKKQTQLVPYAELNLKYNILSVGR